MKAPKYYLHDGTYYCTECEFFSVDFEKGILYHVLTEHLKSKKKYSRKRKDVENKLPLKGVGNGQFIP